MLAGIAWMKLSELPGWTADLGGISTRPAPFAAKAPCTASITRPIDTPVASTSARLRYRMLRPAEGGGMGAG